MTALPAPALRAAADAIEALELLGRELRELGPRSEPVRRFNAYHLADLEGAESAGWLGGPFLVDAIRELIGGGSDVEGQ